MKYNQFKVILLSAVVVLLSSCLGTNDPVDASTDPTFVSLTFSKNDSIPKLETAVFTLEGKTIVNLDSLPYQTRIDSVFPSFKFASSSKLLLNDSVLLTGKDTVDFSLPVRIRNYAADGETYEDYTVKVNVHQVNPELYKWSKVTADIVTHDIVDQHAVVLNDKILYYLNDGTTVRLYASENGYAWSNGVVANLPADAPLRQITVLNSKMYLLHGGDKVYSSTDGQNWVNTSCEPFGYNYSTLLFVLNNKLWAIAQSTTDQKSYFTNSTDGISWNVITSAQVPANFPVRDFASVSFSTRTGKAKALVLGGYNADNVFLKNSWSTENGEYWVDFSLENKSLDSLAAGASLIAYDNKLFLFGAMTKNVGIQGNYFRQSVNEGYSWSVPDTLNNRLPQEYGNRMYQSVVVYKSDKLNKDFNANRIFVLGGKSNSTVYSDIWTGKLNRKSFIRQ